MNVVRAVLDANVYISAAVQPQGPTGQITERFLGECAFELVTSAIADEVRRGLAYPKVRKHIRATSDPRACRPCSYPDSWWFVEHMKCPAEVESRPVPGGQMRTSSR